MMTLAVNNLCVLDNRENLDFLGFMNLRDFFTLCRRSLV